MPHEYINTTQLGEREKMKEAGWSWMQLGGNEREEKEKEAVSVCTQSSEEEKQVSKLEKLPVILVWRVRAARRRFYNQTVLSESIVVKFVFGARLLPYITATTRFTS